MRVEACPSRRTNLKVGKFGRSKPCHLVPLLYHTYAKFDCSTKLERSEYEKKPKEELRTLPTFSDNNMELESDKEQDVPPPTGGAGPPQRTTLFQVSEEEMEVNPLQLEEGAAQVPKSDATEVLVEEVEQDYPVVNRGVKRRMSFKKD